MRLKREKLGARTSEASDNTNHSSNNTNSNNSNNNNKTPTTTTTQTQSNIGAKSAEAKKFDNSAPESETMANEVNSLS